jgi:hypothetical protein
VIEFLESFRLLHQRGRPASRRISMKVPEALLDAFRRRCRLEEEPYQGQIKNLMLAWLRGDGGSGGEGPWRQPLRRPLRPCPAAPGVRDGRPPRRRPQSYSTCSNAAPAGLPS